MTDNLIPAILIVSTLASYTTVLLMLTLAVCSSYNNPILSCTHTLLDV